MTSSDRTDITEHIVNCIRKNVPSARSILLTGSRARGDAFDLPEFASDYDIAVVVNTVQTFRVFRQLKRIEKALSAQIGAPVTLNPLPMLRIQRHHGNYLLLKYAQEAKLLWGDNFLLPLQNTRAQDIPNEWHIFYIASLTKELVTHTSIRFLRGQDENNTFTHVMKARKALLGCAELFLLRQGHYEGRSSVLIDTIQEGPLGDDLLRFAREPTKIVDVAEARSAWFAAQDHLLNALADSLGTSDRKRGESLGQHCWELGTRRRYMKDLQYIVSLAIQNHQFAPRALWPSTSVDDRIRTSLFLLLESVQSNGEVTEDLLVLARSILNGRISVPKPHTQPAEEWTHLQQAVALAFPHACSALGIL